MAGAIKAIETRYNGYRFRSRAEARWAVFFDASGRPYEYEKEGYSLPSGYYLPDFWCPYPGGGFWFEVKGRDPTSIERTLARELAIHTGHSVWVAYGPVTEEGHRIIEFDANGMEGAPRAYGFGHRAAFEAAKSARFEHGESPDKVGSPDALKNLDAWVPQLDLPKLQRHGDGYKAVPFWIPCPRGLSLHKRSPTLVFSKFGIVDIGYMGVSYAPVDVVIGALGCTSDFADDWLNSKMPVRRAAANDNCGNLIGPALPKTLLEEFGIRAIERALNELERAGQIRILGDSTHLAA